MALVSSGILITGLRLRAADLATPFEYDADTLLILPYVQAILEGGTHWENPRLGAPGTQALYDYPVVDALHFTILRGMGLVWPHAVGIFNLYYLLGYPLAALIAMGVGRRLGLSLAAAAMVGLLFAFQPYHWMRGETHYFLSAYYVVPLSLLPGLLACKGEGPFLKGTTVYSLVGLVAIGVLTACGGAYYAFFACAFSAAAGLYAVARWRTWRAAAAVSVLVAIIAAVGVVLHLPTMRYQAEHGRNAITDRPAVDAEHYGLKPATLFLPVPEHRLPALAELRANYDHPSRPLQNENASATLGIIAALGLAGLLLSFAFPDIEAWPVRPLSFLALVGLLLGTVGGLGALLADLVFPPIRGYSRISIFLAVFALLAVGFAIDRTVKRPRLKWLACLLLTTLGIADQCNRNWFSPAASHTRALVAMRYRADAEFFASIEAAVPGGMVFTQPYMRYPENDQAEPRLSPYWMVRGYLHTRTMQWSFGAIKRREVDQWQEETAALPPEEMLRRLAMHGFDVLDLERRGFDPAQAEILLAAIEAELGAPRWTHLDGSQVAFDLRPYRERLRERLGAAFDHQRLAEEAQTRALWLAGFSNDFDPGPGTMRWCDRHGEMVLLNPTTQPVRVKLRMTLQTHGKEPCELAIANAIWSDVLSIGPEPRTYERMLTLPPGKQIVCLHCRALHGRLSHGPYGPYGVRPVFSVTDFHIEPEKSP